jgi:hypothetical protein
MERREPWPKALEKWLSEAADTNPYATAETMRAWDNVLRGALADGLEAAARRWRDWAVDAQKAMPTPSREHPWPDPGLLANVRSLRETAARCSDLAAAVRALEMPGEDRVYNRLRSHGPLLDLLLAYDSQLADCLNELDALAAPAPLGQEPARRAKLEAILSRLEHTLRARREALAPRGP